MKTFLLRSLTAFLLAVISIGANAKSFVVSSPDKKLTVEVTLTNGAQRRSLRPHQIKFL